MSIYSKNHNSQIDLTQIDLKLSLHVVLIELLFLLLGDSRDVGIGVLASLEFLLDRDERVYTVDEHLDELEFGEAKSVSVGNVEHATFGGGVDATLIKRYCRFKMLRSYQFLASGVGACQEDRRISRARRASRASCEHQLGHRFLKSTN